MKTILSIASVLAALVPAVAMADPDPSRQPIDQGIESVSKNIARDPDNKGLQNAGQRLFENQIRQSAHREQGPGSIERVERVERVERPQRPERIERIDLSSRAEIARAQRPERPEKGNGKGR